MLTTSYERPSHSAAFGKSSPWASAAHPRRSASLTGVGWSSSSKRVVGCS